MKTRVQVVPGIRRTAAIAVAGAALLAPAGGARAVVIRHDVPDVAYRRQARAAPFAAARATLLTPGQATSGTLISPRHVLTAGHLVAHWVPAGSREAPAAIGIRIGTNRLTGVRVHLFPGFDRRRPWGGADVAIVRLSGRVTNVPPAALWIGGVKTGQRFAGIGRGRTGTGLDNHEPLPGGAFRGYENTIDHLYGSAAHRHWRTDFDNGRAAGNTLAYVLFDTTNRPLAGRSAATPLPLEGTLAAGDSGSAAFVRKDGKWRLAGVASYRWYSQYGGQAGYVNLSAPEIVAWLRAVAARENAAFRFVRRTGRP